jgi:hypothetical protein
MTTEQDRRADNGAMTVREVYAILRERTTAVDKRFEMQERAVQNAFDAAKDAVDKAETASEKRFDAVNEFRGQQRDLIATFLPRNEYAVQFESVVKRVTTMETAYANLQGRMWAVSALFAIATLVVAVGVRFIH